VGIHPGEGPRCLPQRNLRASVNREYFPFASQAWDARSAGAGSCSCNTAGLWQRSPIQAPYIAPSTKVPNEDWIGAVGVHYVNLLGIEDYACLGAAVLTPLVRIPS
jgi:hypothetical protein